MEPIYVFVYGTLMKKFKDLNNATRDFHQKNSYIKSAYIKGFLYQIDWYPGLELDNNGLKIYGEIYQIDSIETLHLLDNYEDATIYPNIDKEYEYYRTQIVIEGYNCNIYLLSEIKKNYIKLDILKFQPFN
jgi:gamma-glutamylcyclotransferase (GGCT)/AIG2-like uncharacterized protein YtfP